MIFGFLLIGAGFSFEGTLPTFATVLIAQVIWVAGYKFMRGALRAWIADESSGQDLGRIYLRGEQADYVGSFFGVFASALLATVALNLPLLLAGALAGVLGVTLTFLMQERNFRPTPREGRAGWATRRAAASGSCAAVRCS